MGGVFEDIGEFIAGFFGGLGQKIAALFGFASTDEKLGQMEVSTADQSQTIKEVKQAYDSDSISDKLGDDALRVQLSRFKRP